MAQRKRPAAANKKKPLPDLPREPQWRKLQSQPRQARRRVPATVAAAGRPANVLRTPWLSRFIGVVGVVGVLVGGFWLLLSGSLTVTAARVIVQGNQRVPAETIQAASGVEGQLVFRVQPARVAERVAQTPGIASARVRVLPLATVLIDVQEHVPLVAWQGITETIWLAADGEVIPATGDPPPITLVDRQGAARSGTGKLRRQVLAYLAALHAARPEVTEVHYGALEGLYYRAAQGWTVYLGEMGAIEQKLQLLNGIEQEAIAGKQHLEMIDLRSTDHGQIR